MDELLNKIDRSLYDRQTDRQRNRQMVKLRDKKVGINK